MLIALSRIFVGRPFGILFSESIIPDVFGLFFSYLEHHPWLRFLVRGSNISMTLKSCGELSTVPQFIYCFFAFNCIEDSWYVGHDTWLACQRSRVRFREETFFLARKNLRNLRTLTSESILEILAPMVIARFSKGLSN